MTARQSSPSSEHSAHSDSGVRKRVCKACDRCRLKKSKVLFSSLFTCSNHCTDYMYSVTARVPAVAVERTMRSACLASAKRPTIRSIPKGELISH